MLFIRLFNMKDVCFVKIHPPFQKKNSASNFILKNYDFRDYEGLLGKPEQYWF